MTTSLSQYEMQLVNDAEVIFTKTKIVEKVYKLFGELAEGYEKELAKREAKLNFATAKIAKGENYKGLPYVIMDYPRFFSRTDVFAVRSFFWWGNFFSITLHLSGSYLERFLPAIQHALQNNSFDDWFVNASDEQWHHHFEGSNYKLIMPGDDLTTKELPFIKLAKKIPLQEWDSSKTFFDENFRKIMQVLFHQAPMR